MDFLPSSRQTQSASVRYESRRAQRSHPSLKTVLTRLYICGGSYFCKQRNSPSHRVSRTFWKSEKPEFCLMFRLNKKEQLKHPCCRGESVRPGVSFSESVIWFIYRPVRAHKVPLWSHYITQLHNNEIKAESLSVRELNISSLILSVRLRTNSSCSSFVSFISSERSHVSCCSSSRLHVTKRSAQQLLKRVINGTWEETPQFHIHHLIRQDIWCL